MDNFSEHLYPLEEKPVFFLIYNPWLAGSWFPNKGLNPGPGSNMLSPNHWTSREFPEKPFFLNYAINIVL